MPAAEENTTPESVIKKNRVQLEHALFDVDFLHKPKIVAMRRKFGDLSALAYFEIICQLSRATDARIEVDTVFAVAESFRIDDPNVWLDYCLSKERVLLERDQDGWITQERVGLDQEKLAEQRDAWRKRKRPQEDSREIPTRKQGEEHEKVVATVNTEDLNTEDLKKEEKKKEENFSDWRAGGAPTGLRQLEKHVFIEDWRYPELLAWFKRSGFEDPAKAIEFAAAVVNGHYEQRGRSSRDCPAKAYSDLISWGNREAQNTKKAKADVKISEARAKLVANDPRNQTRPRPQVLNERAALPPQVKELIDSVVPLVEMPVQK